MSALILDKKLNGKYFCKRLLSLKNFIKIIFVDTSDYIINNKDMWNLFPFLVNLEI